MRLDINYKLIGNEIRGCRFQDFIAVSILFDLQFAIYFLDEDKLLSERQNSLHSLCESRTLQSQGLPINSRKTSRATEKHLKMFLFVLV